MPSVHLRSKYSSQTNRRVPDRLEKMKTGRHANQRCQNRLDAPVDCSGSIIRRSSTQEIPIACDSRHTNALFAGFACEHPVNNWLASDTISTSAVDNAPLP